MCFGICGNEGGRRGRKGKGGCMVRKVFLRDVEQEGSCRGGEVRSCRNCPSKEGIKGVKSGKERKWL